MGGVEADRAAHAVFLRLFHDDVRHRVADHLAELEVPVHDGRGRRLLYDLDLCAGDDLAHLHLVQILGDADDAVGIIAHKICQNEFLCHKGGFFRVKTALQKDFFGIRFQVFVIDFHVYPRFQM